MAEEKHLQEGMLTHKNLAHVYFVEMLNTGIAASASMGAVKELGLDLAASRASSIGFWFNNLLKPTEKMNLHAS